MLLTSAIVSQLAFSQEVEKMPEIEVKAKAEKNRRLEFHRSTSVGLEIAETTVSREDIEKLNARTLTDALDTAPGALTETRGRKIKQLTSFRGQIYPYPSYAINGIWQREFHEIPYVIPAEMVEEIDIMRSSGSLMLGLSDISGVINVKTRRFKDETTIVGAEYGSYDSQKLSLVNGNSFDNSWYTLGLTRWRTEGPSDENAAEEIHSLFLNSGWKFNELTLEMNAFYINGNRELRKGNEDTSGSMQQRTEEYDPFEYMSLSFKGTYKHSSDLTTEMTTYVSHRRADYERRDWRPTEYFEEDYEYGLSLSQARKLSQDNTLSYGVHYNHWVAPKGKRNYVGNRMDQHTYALSVVDEHVFDKLIIDAGFRYARTYDKDNSGHAFNITGSNNSFANPIEDEWREPELRWSLGGKYLLTNITTLYSNFTFGMLDAPNGATTVDFESPARENRYMVDAGVKFASEEYGFVKIGGFYTFRDNAITLSGQTAIDPGTGEEYDLYLNRDIQQYGLEFEARSAKINKMFELFTSATLMDSEADSGDGYENYSEIPDFIANAGIYSEIGNFDFNFFAKYVSWFENSRFSGNGEYQDLGDFWDLNLNFGYKLAPQTRVYCSLENLLDDEYSTVVGYPDYGFQGFVGIKHQF